MVKRQRVMGWDWMAVFAGLVVVSLVGSPWAGAQDNNEPTGVPTISGTVRVGEKLTADASAIDDADGMTEADLDYQWIATDGTDRYLIVIYSAGTGFVIPAWVEGMTLSVIVQFRDDGGYYENVPSAETAAVAAMSSPTKPEPPSMRELELVPAGSGALELTWGSDQYSDGGSIITGHKLQWKPYRDGWGSSAVSEHTITYEEGEYARYRNSYTITGLTNERSVSARVLATNKVGDSDWSAEIVATPYETGRFFMSGVFDGEFEELCRGEIAEFEAHNPAGGTVTWDLWNTDADDFFVHGSVLSPGTSNTRWFGNLRFEGIPDYESPTDANQDNTYVFNVQATDGRSTVSILVSLDVTDVADNQRMSLSSSRPVVGRQLVATIVDPDDDLDDVYWAWSRSRDRTNWEVVTKTWPDHGGATSSYTPVADDIGYYLRASSSYSLDDGYDTTCSKHPEAVSANAVRATSPPTKPPPPRTGGGSGGGGGGSGGGGSGGGGGGGVPVPRLVYPLSMKVPGLPGRWRRTPGPV